MVRLRGCSADVVILEEAAYIPPECFFQVIVPLLGVKNTALLGISTPSTEFNYYSELVALKDAHGEPLFHAIQIGLVCNACKASGAKCNHKLALNPHWKPPERMAKVDAIMASNPAMRDRETRGVVASTSLYVVRQEAVEALKARALFEFPEGQPGVLFSMIDPSGAGGGSSQWAILTMTICNGIPVIVAISRTSSGDHKVIYDMLIKHYRTLRESPLYGRCLVRVWVEANLSHIDSSRIGDQLMETRDLQPLEMVREGRSDIVGFLTDWPKKTAFAEELARNMPLLRFAEQFMCPDPEATKLELYDQISRFRREVKQGNEGALVAKVTHTGKSAGHCDDLAMVLMMGLYFSYRTIHDAPFIARMRAQHIPFG